MSGTYQEVVTLVHQLSQEELEEVRAYVEALLHVELEDEELSPRAKAAFQRARSGKGVLYDDNELDAILEARGKR